MQPESSILGYERWLILAYEKVLQIFEAIYGANLHKNYLNKIIDVLDNFSPTMPQPSTRLDSRDSLLITYGDAIQSEETPPIQTLHRFLSTEVKDAISAVHLLPFFPYSSDDGFSVVEYTQVNPDLGDWSDIVALGKDYDLAIDAVINHISVESIWFQRFLAGDKPFTDYFITIDPSEDLREVFRPRDLPLLTLFETQSGQKYVWTTFSEDQVDLNYHNPEVLIEVIRILLMFVERGARYFRMDAIAYLWKDIGTSCIHLDNTHRVVQLLRAIFDAVAPYVQIITETNVPHEENVSYFGDGTNEAQMVYNFSLPPLVLNAFHHQNASILSRWAKTLKFPSDKTHFFNFTASHDGIGITPAKGLIPDEDIQEMCEQIEALGGFVSYKINPDGSRSAYELNINYLDALGDPNFPDEDDGLIADRFLASQAIMLALKGVPGIYYHSLLGSRSWREGVKHTGRKRTINREKLNYQDLLDEVHKGGTLRSKVFNGYLDLLKARGEGAIEAFDPAAGQEIIEYDDRLFCIMRNALSGTQCVLCVMNVSRDGLVLDLDHDLYPGLWEILYTHNSDLKLAGDVLQITFAPYGVIWLLNQT
ncbi:MAG TPA: sugar phosphorylase [Anaerolineaceae bacterium]|nr:sugar phosphorylase [Anaerolineaceae bacterium]